MRSISSLTSFIVSGLLAAAGTLFVGWPSVVDAEAPEAEAAEVGSATATAVNAPQNAELRANESKIGDLVVSATLTEAAPGRHVIHLECENPTAMLIAGNVHLEMGRNDGMPMGRVEPPPTIVWRRNEAVKVPAGETVVREIALPTQFSKEMNRLAKLHRAAEDNPNIIPPYVYYSAMAYPVVPNAAADSNNRVALRKGANSLAAARPTDGEQPEIAEAPAAAPLPLAASEAASPVAKTSSPATVPAALGARPVLTKSATPNQVSSSSGRPRLSAKAKMSSAPADLGF